MHLVIIRVIDICHKKYFIQKVAHDYRELQRINAWGVVTTDANCRMKYIMILRRFRQELQQFSVIVHG